MDRARCGDAASTAPPSTEHRLSPAGLTLTRAYVTPTEERALMQHIHAVAPAKWTQLSRRRLQNWGGVPHPSGMLASPLPPWLARVATRLHRDGHQPFVANHALVNEYAPGQGIMMHEDGPLYEPSAAILSLESAIALEFARKGGDNASDATTAHFALQLPPRSLLVMSGAAYTDYLHGIAERRDDPLPPPVDDEHEAPRRQPRQRRTSLTFRRVRKTLDARRLRLPGRR